MTSRHSYPGSQASEPSGAKAQPRTPLFVLSLATFVGSLVFLAATLIQIPAQRNGTLDDVAAGGADEPAAVSAGGLSPGAADGGSGPVASPPLDDPVLRRAIEDALGADIEHVSVVVYRFTDGRSASVNAEREYYAASTFKLAILYEAERRSSAGEIDLESVLYFNDDDLSEDLGTLDYLEFRADGGISVRAALEGMIVYSDNSSAVALLHLLGGGAIDDSLRALGLTTMSLNTRDLPTTARDLSLLMAAIVEGRDVSPSARDEMRALLLRQRTRDGIPAGLPLDVLAGNKTGTWEGATHDIAFVEAPGGTYVLGILSDQGWAWEPLRAVSEAVFREMTRRR